MRILRWPVIRVDDHAGRRIHEGRIRTERHDPSPVVFARPAGHRHLAVPFARWQLTDELITDVPIDVRVARRHGRAAEVCSRRAELLPAAGSRELENEIEEAAGVEGRPAKREWRGLPLEDRSDDRPVTGDRDIDDHRLRPPLHRYRFPGDGGRLELALVFVASRIARILSVYAYVRLQAIRSL